MSTLFIPTEDDIRKWALPSLNKGWKINHLKSSLQLIRKKPAQFGNIKPY
jgi:hypothetical protein